MDLALKKDEQIRLPWKTLCSLACVALIRNMDLNSLVEQALQRRIMHRQRQIEALKQLKRQKRR